MRAYSALCRRIQTVARFSEVADRLISMIRCPQRLVLDAQHHLVLGSVPAPSSANECTTSTSHVLEVEFIVNRVFEPSHAAIVQRSLQFDRRQFALPEPAALLEHLLAPCSRAREMLW